jgi:hypothetical protein
MESLRSFLDVAARDAAADRRALLDETRRHRLAALAQTDADRDLLRSAELAALDRQNADLEQALAGVSGLSEEVLAEVHRLKLKKLNTDALLNVLTSMAQATALVGRLDAFTAQSGLDSLKKFVLELRSSLEHVARRFFERELALYDAFAQRTFSY